MEGRTPGPLHFWHLCYINVTDREYEVLPMTVTPLKRKTAHVGLSITQQAIEAAVFSPKNMAIESYAYRLLPEGVLDVDGDVIVNPNALKELIRQTVQELRPKPGYVHLSLPATLLRVTSMPKMEADGMYVSLSSEAERYKTFDHSEAIVDMVPLDVPGTPPQQQALLFGAVRNDTLNQYLKILKELKLKACSISLESVNVMRAMAGTGVLDGLIQQVGTDSVWGVLFVEPSRVRFSLWQGDRLLEMRETAMDTRGFAHATVDDMVVEDLLEEIRRTAKNLQPVLWLTHNMPPALEQTLASRAGCPFRAAPLGQGLQITQPMQLAVVGAALSSTVQFPFDFDISAGVGRSGGHAHESKPAAIASGAAEEGGGNVLMPLGGLAIVFGLLITGALMAGAWLAGQGIPELESKVSGVQNEIAQLELEQRALKKQLELDDLLLSLIRQARMRNHVYVAMTEDLTRKTPERIWISVLEANTGMKLHGKALNHQSVINFARSFDSAPYTGAVLIDSIKEGRLNGVRIFDFVIGGRVNLDLPLPSEENADSATESPVGMQAPLSPNQPAPASQG